MLSSENEQVINELVSLALGYSQINTDKSYKNVLAIEEQFARQIDLRFIDELNKLSQSPTHELARFILREAIEYVGVLVDESILLARLGIDKENSKDWEKLKASLDEFKYKGVFADAWERWWWFRIDEWLMQEFGIEDLKGISAKERVKIISNNKLNLIGAVPLEYSNSTQFWTICFVTKKPLDPYEGFVVDKKIHFPWQEEFYVSRKAVVDEIDIDNWKISIIDKQRLLNFKQALRNG